MVRRFEAAAVTYPGATWSVGWEFKPSKCWVKDGLAEVKIEPHICG